MALLHSDHQCELFDNFDCVCYNQDMSKQHGGKRPGSGRKPVSTTEPIVRVRATLLRSQWEWLTRSGNASQTIRTLVQKEIDHERQNQNLHDQP